MKSALRMLVLCALALAIAWVVRTYLLAIYLVPTPSMEPTIRANDIIVAIKSLTKNRTPKPNEVWLFNMHVRNHFGDTVYKVMVKRICGLPNDTIGFVNGRLTLNGLLVGQPLAAERVLTYSTLNLHGLSVFPNDTSVTKWTSLNFGPLWIPAKGITIPLNKRNRILYGRLIMKESPTYSLAADGQILEGEHPVRQYTFRQNYYFACGDNLNFSSDSRHWGFVSEEKFLSMAKLVIASTNQKKNFNPDSWFRMVR